MKLEKFIFQDGAAYEFTGEYKAPLDGDYYFSATKEAKIRQWNGGPTKYSRPIYKLSPPAVVEQNGKKYKFTGLLAIPKKGDYFLNSGGIFGVEINNHKPSFFASEFYYDYPIYTLIEEKKHPVEKTNEYFDKASEVLDEVYDALKGISAFGDNLKKKYTPPPPFIKQGEDYYLFTGKRLNMPDKGAYYATLGEIVQSNGMPLHFPYPIYIKLSPVILQGNRMFIFSGEYRKAKLEDYFLFFENLEDYIEDDPEKMKIVQSEIGRSLSKHAIYLTWEQYVAKERLGSVSEILDFNGKMNKWIKEGGPNKSMSGVAIQKLQEKKYPKLNREQLLSLWSIWTSNYPVLCFANVDYDKCPKFQKFKTNFEHCLPFPKLFGKKEDRFKQHKIDIVTAIIFNGPEYQGNDTVDVADAFHIGGLNNRYMKELSFDELKSLKLQFLSGESLIPAVVEQGSDREKYYFSAINYKILE
jgi:hypothetical protein